jgi:outer membrane receptor protein involved in Fe transport
MEIDGQYSMANNDNSQWAPFLQSQGFPVPKQGIWDGGTENFSVLMGMNSANGKGNITIYGTYFHQQAITQDARDFSACSTATNYVDGFFCAGSSTIPQGRFTSVDLGAAFSSAGSTAPGPSSFVPDSTKTFSPYAGQTFNFAPYNYIQRPDTRYTFGALGHYQLSEQVDFYTSLMFMDDHTIANVAPGGAFQTPFLINCDNPLMSAQEQATICPATALDGNSVVTPVTPINGGAFGPGSTSNATILLGRRAIESGPRVDDLRHQQYRIVLGVRGQLDSSWSYDAYAQYGVTTYGDNQTGFWSSNNLSKALQVVSGPGGVPTCKSVIDQSDPNCVPIDVFAPASLTPAMLGYVSTNGVAIGETREEIVSASMTGDLGSWGVQSPWAKSAVSVAFGGEYREESLTYEPDQELRTGDLQGLGGKRPGQSGRYSVGEGFLELRLPIIEDAPGAERLEASAAYRYSSYSNAGATNTYKVGLEYQPMDDFRLRGSFQHAVRAPNTTELFTPSAVVLFGGQDPCANNSKTNAPPSLAKWNANNCDAQGLSPTDRGAVFPCPAAQCQQQELGNIALKPEESDTWSAGIVLTPTMIQNFSMTIDWYYIKVNRAIGQVGALTILGDCEGGNLAACAQIHRDPTTKTLWTGDGYVENPTQNLGFVKTSGIDIESSYLMSLDDLGAEGYGGLNFNFIGTFVSEFDNQGAPPSSPFFSGVLTCAGLYGPTCAGSGISVATPVYPRWRNKLRMTWDTPWEATFSIAWRHISSVALDANALAVRAGNPPVDTNPFDAHIPAFDYIDLAATWQATNWFQLRLGINNVFDKDPPVVDTSNLGISGPPFGNGNTFPQVYDSLGRVLFIGGTAKF